MEDYEDSDQNLDLLSHCVADYICSNSKFNMRYVPKPQVLAHMYSY